MTPTQGVPPFWTWHNLLEPNGPVCLTIQAEMGIAADLDRFQPAKFPGGIDHVIYPSPDPARGKVCIVDSPASMANHLESVCIPDGECLHDDLDGLPYVECVSDPRPSGTSAARAEPANHELVTTSLSEGHRIASDYFVSIKDKPRVLGGENDGQVFRHVLRREFEIEEIKQDSTYFDPPAAQWAIYRTLFRYDPNSLIHGVLFAKEQIKISRMLTAHHDALRADRVPRSGVMFNKLTTQPIFSVEDVKAEKIVTTFVLDLGLLRSYGRDAKGNRVAVGLNREQKELLLTLALWKIRKLLTHIFRYRSGCQLWARGVKVRLDTATEPVGHEVPAVDIAAAIKAAKFGDSPVTRVYYPRAKLAKVTEDGPEAAGEEDTGDDGGDDGGDGGDE